MALTDNLVSYWKFDESSGDAADSHGTNTLTNNGTIPYVSAKLNNGADLEAADAADYFSKTDTADLSFTSDMSWSFWIKQESDTAPVVVAKWGAAGQRAYYIQITGATNVRLGTSAGGTNLNFGDVAVSSMTQDGTTWYHIVVTKAGTLLTVYQNGVSQGTDNTVDSTMTDGTTALEIGAYQEGGARSNFVDGVIDEMGCWSRAITSSEVTDLYNGGTPLAYPLTVAVKSSRRRMMTGIGQ